MAQRTVCVCDGEYIGIESIYTVINGRQINIPNKVEALREKGRRNQLFCPCGCGANLTLVAGDRNLREQHFRLKAGEYEQECHLVTEGKCSVDSKIVLKCWLDDKLKNANIQSRVPINAVDDTNRKYEFTLLSKEKAIAISYSHERVNLSDEKFDILESNSKNIKIIYIVDELNGGVCGQYPESLMKIQLRQGYCLYLSIEDIDYYKAELEAAFFAQDIDGMWQEVSFAHNKISKFDIDDKGNVLLNNQSMDDLCQRAKEAFDEEQEAKKQQREKEALAQAERIRRLEAEEERKKEERRRQQEEQQKELERQKAEAEKRRAELAEKQRIDRERQEQEKREREEAFKAALEDNFSRQDSQIRDADGNRWIKCEFCGKIAMEAEFSSYGGLGRVNLGTCYDCSKNNPAVHEKIVRQSEIIKKKYDSNMCPDCGGQLRERSGRFGSFMGCSNYPNCKYTRRISGKKY